ncbi:MAG: UDP-4-amino-4,6-dideoxy-N-acetyl-beta-L-altrosamine transaminase [Planctomycetes bacterium]|nr:UDP-4-amino-4,6-dideoxy-N-acetyl-beta-L-altrosamine transaminase [Planctomycetota bacterium]
MNKTQTDFIPYAFPLTEAVDIDSVCEVLRGTWLSQGPMTRKFESQIADYCNAKYAVVVSSGTAALHLSCMALELSQADSHWVPPITFVATANCGVYCGSTPEFVDIDSSTYNMDVAVLEEKLKEAKRKGKLPRVVIPVHFAGLACEMERIYALSEQYNFRIIEDACHSIGASYQTSSGERCKIGSCSHCDMTVFSFQSVKHIATGEGGCITTNNKELYEKLVMLRNHGITRQKELLSNKEDMPWYYEMQMLGFNYRLSDIHCALGSSQLTRLDKMVKWRQEKALLYDDLLSNARAVTPQKRIAGFDNSFHLYVVQIDYESYGTSRTEVMNSLKELGIGTQVHYIPIHFQPFYQNKFGTKAVCCPNAEKYYSKALSLPMFANISTEIVTRVVKGLLGVLKDD